MATRLDNLKCAPGNKACGKRCVPISFKCAGGQTVKTLSQGEKDKVFQIQQRLRKKRAEKNKNSRAPSSDKRAQKVKQIANRLKTFESKTTKEEDARAEKVKSIQNRLKSFESKGSQNRNTPASNAKPRTKSSIQRAQSNSSKANSRAESALSGVKEAKAAIAQTDKAKSAATRALGSLPKEQRNGPKAKKLKAEITSLNKQAERQISAFTRAQAIAKDEQVNVERNSGHVASSEFRRKRTALGRNDRYDVKCKSGNKPCGARCIPRNHRCLSNGDVAKRAGVVAGIGALALTAGALSNQKGAQSGGRRRRGGGGGDDGGGPPPGPKLISPSGSPTAALPPGRSAEVKPQKKRAKAAVPRKRRDGFEERSDMKCGPGNKPCGKRCIPRKQNCQSDGQSENFKKQHRTGMAIGGLATLGITGALSADYMRRSKEQFERRKNRSGPGALATRSRDQTQISTRKRRKDSLEDRFDMKCGPGNKPCGKRCIPRDQKCKNSDRAVQTGLGVAAAGAAAVGAGALLARGSNSQKALPGSNRKALPGGSNSQKRLPGQSNLPGGSPKQKRLPGRRRRDTAEERLDMKCGPGNKPCGKRCIPRTQKCKGGGGPIGGIQNLSGNNTARNVGLGIGAVAGTAAILAQGRGNKNKQKALPGSNRKALPGGSNSQKRLPGQSNLPGGSPAQKRLPGRRRRDAAEERFDLKCSPGNKPCGKRCIPRAQNCNSEGAARRHLNSPEGKRQIRTQNAVAGGAAALGVGALVAAGISRTGGKSNLATPGKRSLPPGGRMTQVSVREARPEISGSGRRKALSPGQARLGQGRKAITGAPPSTHTAGADPKSTSSSRVRALPPARDNNVRPGPSARPQVKPGGALVAKGSNSAKSSTALAPKKTPEDKVSQAVKRLKGFVKNEFNQEVQEERAQKAHQRAERVTKKVKKKLKEATTPEKIRGGARRAAQAVHSVKRRFKRN